jgi:hypothetical protein
MFCLVTIAISPVDHTETKGCPHDCNFCSVKRCLGRGSGKSHGGDIAGMVAIQEISQNNRCVFNEEICLSIDQARELLKEWNP